MRLIDADAVEYSIWREWICSKTTKEKELCNILEKVIDRCCEHIDNAPTIDAEPVRHGHWCDNGIKGSILNGCSICGYTCGAYSFNYCPNCGAKMGEEDNT